MILTKNGNPLPLPGNRSRSPLSDVPPGRAPGCEKYIASRFLPSMALLLRHPEERDFHRRLGAVPAQDQRGLVPFLLPPDKVDDVGRIPDRLPVERNDHVPGTNAGLFGGGAFPAPPGHRGVIPPRHPASPPAPRRGRTR